MIISGGFNIAPREVEDVLSEHPDVLDCAVIGIPDPVWGQSVRAYTELAPGSTISPEELISFASPRLGYRRPRSLVVVDALPYSLNGKVDRKELLRRSNGSSEHSDGGVTA
jgi:acyl-CoA synthetase (AMP-forming)/AMP-acid ligase II